MTDQTKPRRNWWKVAFFVALVAFEFTREVAVIADARGARPNASFQVFDGGNGYVTASGQWKRADGGEKLVPTTVRIECRQDLGICIEAYAHIMDEYVLTPEVDIFEAKFAPDAVTYENDMPTCADYSVRIDLKMRQVFSTRLRKDGATGDCARLEPRLSSQLAASTATEENPLVGHFVPLLQGIAAFF